MLDVLYDKILETYLWVIGTEIYGRATYVFQAFFWATILVLVILVVGVAVL